MITETFKKVLKQEGVVSIVTWSDGAPHISMTWISYLTLTEDGRLLIPAAYMNNTEKNIEKNNKVKLSLGSREVMGFNDYQGTGFIIEGTASFIAEGEEFETIKAKFPFLTRVLSIKIDKLDQKI